MKKIIRIMTVVMLLVSCTVGCSQSNKSDAPYEKDSGSSQVAPNGKAESSKSWNKNNGKFYRYQSEDKNESIVRDEKNYNDTYFENYGVNPEIVVSEESTSTFALDVDTASYTKARNYIEQGSLPPKDSIRVEEFVNYFKRHYDSPKKDTFSIYTEMAPSVFNKDCHMIEIGVQGKEVTGVEKKNSNLTFVIDISGSMNMDNRLGLVKKSLNMLVDQLGKDDKIGIAVYGSEGKIYLNHAAVDDKEYLKNKINSLESEGSTNAAEGIKIGYEMANEVFDKNANNRIILCTDGVANQGLTDAEEILRTVEDYSKRGITLTSIGFGMDNYNDIFLEKLADKGDGNYSFIDSIDEAQKIFTQELTSVLQVIAKDAKTQVEFDEKSVESYRLIGYENRKLENEDFRNDSVDAGEVGAGHAVTALYEVKLKKDISDDIAIVRLRYKDPETNKAEEVSKKIKASDVKKTFYDATPRFRFVNMVARFAEVLRMNEYSQGDINEVYDLLKNDERKVVANKEDSEFIELVRKTVTMGVNEQR